MTIEKSVWIESVAEQLIDYCSEHKMNAKTARGIWKFLRPKLVDGFEQGVFFGIKIGRVKGE